MSDTQTLLQALGKPFPKEAVKTRVGGGGAKFDYVAGYTVIHRLNDATGGQWSWHVKSFEFRPAGTDRYGKEVSLVVVTGELTIPGLGTRAGIGVQKVTENGGEDLVKGASTDALKKAATLFGVALELYGDDYEDEDRAPAPQRQQPARPAPRPTPPPAASAEHPLLATIRDDTAAPSKRLTALHNYLMDARSLDVLAYGCNQALAAGIPEADIERAKAWHNERIMTGKPPAPKKAPQPASIAG